MSSQTRCNLTCPFSFYILELLAVQKQNLAGIKQQATKLNNLAKTRLGCQKENSLTMTVFTLEIEEQDSGKFIWFLFFRLRSVATWIRTLNLPLARRTPTELPQRLCLLYYMLTNITIIWTVTVNLYNRAQKRDINHSKCKKNPHGYPLLQISSSLLNSTHLILIIFKSYEHVL